MAVALTLGLLQPWPHGSAGAVAVPPALQQRQQPEAVEAIIKALEQKATAVGDGTWSSTSGSHNAPGLPSTTGVRSGQWYWRGGVDGGNVVTTVFSDGESFYELPRRVWYGIDAAEGGNRLNYGVGHYLLHVNLFPRRFLGAAGGLVVLGEKAIDGVTYTRLQADPMRDELAAADPYLDVKQSRAVIDYYYDAARNAIARVAIAHRTGVSTSRVTTWDKFGTSGDWPKKIEGARAGILYLTSIDGFTPGEDPEVAAVAQAVGATPFFSADLAHLRQPATYAALAAADPKNLSMQVVLTEATLRAGHLQAGTEKWDAIAEQLSAEEGQLLAKTLAPSASIALHEARSTEPEASAEMLVRLINLPQARLSNQELLATWKRLRARPKLAERLAPIEPQLLERLARSRNTMVVGGLMRMATADEAVAGKIEPVFERVAATQLPPQGYRTSDFAGLVAGAIEAQQWDRAEKYLASPPWAPGTPEAGKAPATLLVKLIGQRARAAEGTAEMGGVLAGDYQAGGALTAKPDRLAGVTAQRLAVDLGVVAVQAGAPAELVAAGADNPVAWVFWSDVIQELLKKRVRGTEATQKLLETAEALGNAVEQQLVVPGFRSRTLLAMGTSRTLTAASTHSATVRTEYFNRAFALAPSDALRRQAIEGIIAELTGQGQFDEARQAVAGLKPSLATSEAQAWADGAVARIELNKTQGEAQLRALEQQVEADRLGGQLAHLEGRLADAQARQRPAGELAALQQVIDQTRREMGDADGGSGE